MIRELSSVYVLTHSGFVIGCCPVADSQLILELMFLHIRCDCSLAMLLFFLTLVGTCCFILSAILYVVHPTYRASHRHENPVNSGFHKADFSCLWAKRIPADVLSGKRRFSINASKKSSALFFYQNSSCFAPSLL